MKITWEGDIVSIAIPPDGLVAFVTDHRCKDGDVHSTDGSVILTRSGRPVECHICRINNYANKCPDREYSETQGKKTDKHPGTAPTASVP